MYEEFSGGEMGETLEIAHELKGNLSKLHDKYESSVSDMRERLTRLEAAGRDATTDDEMRKLKAEVGDLAMQLEEATRGGGFTAADPDEALAADAAAVVEMKNLAAAGFDKDIVNRPPVEPARDYAAARRWREAYNAYLTGRVERFDDLRGSMPDETFATGQQLFHPSFGFMLPAAEQGRLLEQVFAAGSLRDRVGRGRGRGAMVRTATTNYAALANLSGRVTITVGNENLPYTAGDLPEGHDINYAVNKWAATCRVTADMLEDARNLPAHLSRQAALAMAEVEGRLHISGSGVDQPFGLLTLKEDAVAQSALDRTESAFGSRRTAKSGVADKLGSTTVSAENWTLSNVLRVIGDLHGRYRPGAELIMNRTTWVVLLTLQDADGRFLLAETGGLASSPKLQLMDAPVRINDHMPDVAANEIPIIAADLDAAYEISDRRGMMVLIDPYSAKPSTEYTFSWRSGARPADTRAIRCLKCAA